MNLNDVLEIVVRIWRGGSGGRGGGEDEGRGGRGGGGGGGGETWPKSKKMSLTKVVDRACNALLTCLLFGHWHRTQQKESIFQHPKQQQQWR